MDHARRAGLASLVTVLLFAGVVAASPPARQTSGAAIAAAVAWPPSTGLLVAELVTGGASASDEYVELTNAGSSSLDLAGLEVVYVTSSGSTVTRKASWTSSLLVEPGRHVLIANALGVYAVAADLTYSGGFAATGGALVVRPIGGAPLDSIGWGDATNSFVEGVAAPAPPAGSSVERRPGGASGNTVDTNDNSADLFVQPSPSAQNLAAPPAPPPFPSGSATPSPQPSSDPSSDPSPDPSSDPSPDPSVEPSPEPSPDPSVVPTPSPSPAVSPSPTPSASPSPSPWPTPEPEPSPSPTPDPSPSIEPSATPQPAITIAAARQLADEATVLVEGTVTVALGALESGRAGFVQDATAGIGVYLDAAVVQQIPAGTLVRVQATTGTRFGQRTLRVAISDVAVIGAASLPAPVSVATGGAAEEVEGSRVAVSGVVSEAPSQLADGLGIMVDDGSGPLRIIASPEALGSVPPVRGDVVLAVGPLGQRDSSGTGIGGYRIHATLAGELTIAAPSPSPDSSPEPSGNPEPSADPSATPSSQPSPGASITPAPSSLPSQVPSSSPAPTSQTALDIAAARTKPVGTHVVVRGIVTAEPGRLGTPSLGAIGDASAGLPIKLESPNSLPARSTEVVVHGTLADPYGQLELRVPGDGLSGGAPTTPPAPLEVDGGMLGEATEGRLVAVSGKLLAKPVKSTSGDLSLRIEDADGVEIRILADSSSGISATRFSAGATYRLVGIAGQRASRKGRLDGYRIWLRDVGDVTTISAGGAGSPTPSAGQPGAKSGTSPGAVTPIARALRTQGDTLTIEATVTADVALLDASRRRIVVEDRTAAIEVLLPVDGARPSLGARIRATGTIGRAYGAPRLRAASIAILGGRSPLQPRTLRSAPGAAHEWRLVRVSGKVTDVVRMGGRWRAEVVVAGHPVVISGLAGAAIPATTLIEGRSVTVTGIVRRPYPSASDRRFAVVPRQRGDVAVGPAGAPASHAPSGPTRLATGRPASLVAGPIDVDLVDLAAYAGQIVRVGGSVIELASDGFHLDDGTATASVLLRDGAAEFLPLLELDDVLNAVGTVERHGDTARLVVTDPAGLTRLVDPGEREVIPVREPDPPLPSAEPDPARTRSADLGSPIPASLAGPTGLVSLGLVSVASLAVTMLRRHRARRRLMHRIAVRLAAVSRPRDRDETG